VLYLTFTFTDQALSGRLAALRSANSALAGRAETQAKESVADLERVSGTVLKRDYTHGNIDLYLSIYLASYL